MIELVSASRCVTCDLCIDVCPMNVFDRAESGLPLIARQEDCQTCFLCEAHCPTDALYVAAERQPLPAGRLPDEPALIASGLMGSYRARLGWGKGRKLPRDFSDALQLAQAPAAAPGIVPPGQPIPPQFPATAG
ncbi:4Fe-4S dicluster domain-containing protein [Paracoccus limosus]|uniref:4Fe-4S dicluster domain-containing protein n=1 Tax=Paracoccus limosus TaxID=913252 RepID=A0A844H2Q7_9RHOB|nr:ferredoxin family protein [Paracoccus limosus]MTH33750.1 4Fe-4S dicluster domain-containing protein [Paracoccus limosus]